MDELQELGRFRRFLRGGRFAFSGMRLVVTHPKLWPYVAAPALITMSLFVVLVLLAWPGLGLLLGHVWTPGDQTGWWRIVLWYSFWLVIRLSIITIGAFVLYFASGLFATPFNDRLSEEIETMVLGPYNEQFSLRVLLGDLSNSLIHSMLSMTIWLTVLALSFLLNLIPVAGSVLSFAISAVATAIFLTREAMDGSLSRRRMSFRHKLRVIWAQLPMMLGFGSVAALLLWIPLMNFLLLPMAVAGATLMFCQLEKAGLVPDSKGQLGFRSVRIRNAELADHDLATEEITAHEVRAERIPIQVPEAG